VRQPICWAAEDSSVSLASDRTCFRTSALTALKDGAHYIVEFPFTGGVHGDAERTVARLGNRRWLTPNDGVYEDGPIPVDVAQYRVVGEVDLWMRETRAAAESASELHHQYRVIVGGGNR
jgi:hypothetical protein